MRILIATPLYPPDTAPAAQYVKELALRLSHTHTITVLAYGELPEKVAGARIISVSKKRPLAVRLFAFTQALVQEVRRADIVYLENGASVQLPAFIVSFFTHAPHILHYGDTLAAKRRGMTDVIDRITRTRVARIVRDLPQPRPEILPFASHPTKALDAYDESWTRHIQTLNEIFAHA